MSKLDVVEIWKELHRMPEPGMKEFKTGAYLADALEKLGTRDHQRAFRR